MVLIGLFALASLAQSTLPPSIPQVTDLEVTVFTKSYYKIQQGTTWEDINPIDLVGLKKREKVEKIHSYLDLNDNLITTYELISHINAYPKWYKVPSLRIHDNDGIHLQLDKQKSSPSDRFVQYDHEDSTNYLSNKEVALEYGFLHGYTFSMPNNDQINSSTPVFGNISWSDDQQTLTYSFDNQSEIWDKNNKTIVSVSPLQSGDGFIRITKYYTSEESAALDLLKAIVIEEDLVLLGGICAKKITIEEYSDYVYEGMGANPRNDHSDYSNNDFTVYPNPLKGDILNISVPNKFIGKNVSITFTNALGQPITVQQFYFQSQNQSIQLNTSKFTKGLYFIKLETDDLSQTESFIITN